MGTQTLKVTNDVSVRDMGEGEGLGLDSHIHMVLTWLRHQRRSSIEVPGAIVPLQRG